jgi:phosphate transport system permease protein
VTAVREPETRELRVEPRVPPHERRPRRPRELTSTDFAIVAGCAVSSLSGCWLVLVRLGGGVGWFGFSLCAFLGFLALLWIVTADQLGSTVATDRVMYAVVVTASVVLFVPLAWLFFYVVQRGLTALRPSFFAHDQRGVTPILPATAGGGQHAIVGTLEQVFLALLLSLPLGVLAAIFLNESRSKWRRLVRVFVDAMSGLPSIVAGLFVYAVLILPYAKKIELLSFNGFMASLALALIMLPTISRTVEVVLRLVPDGLREASLALGSTRVRTVWSVVLPTARTGITTAVVLGIARIVGETAPLLFTAFGYDLMNANPFKGAQESLPLFVYRNIRKPDKSAIDRGFAGALVLMLIVIALFALARFIGRDRSKKANRRRRLRVPRFGRKEVSAA